MIQRHSFRGRLGIAAALLLPVLVLLAGPSKAQPPKFPPRGPNIPETVWTCSGCGKEIGRGPFRPAIANCPFCGARFNNTVGGITETNREEMDRRMREMRERTERDMQEMRERAERERERAQANNPAPVPIVPPPGNPFNPPAPNVPSATSMGWSLGIMVLLGIVIVGVLLLAGVGVLIYVVTSTSSADKPRRRRDNGGGFPTHSSNAQFRNRPRD